LTKFIINKKAYLTLRR